MLTADTFKFFDDLKQQITQNHDETIALIDSYLETCHNSHGVSLDWDPNNILWELTIGPKGEYELAGLQDTIDFRLLTRDLNANDGKLKRNQYFYWQFRNSAKIGRKLIE